MRGLIVLLLTVVQLFNYSISISQDILKVKKQKVTSANIIFIGDEYIIAHNKIGINDTISREKIGWFEIQDDSKRNKLDPNDDSYYIAFNAQVEDVIHKFPIEKGNLIYRVKIKMDKKGVTSDLVIEELLRKVYDQLYGHFKKLEMNDGIYSWEGTYIDDFDNFSSNKERAFKAFNSNHNKIKHIGEIKILNDTIELVLKNIYVARYERNYGGSLNGNSMQRITHGYLNTLILGSINKSFRKQDRLSKYFNASSIVESGNNSVYKFIYKFASYLSTVYKEDEFLLR